MLSPENTKSSIIQSCMKIQTTGQFLLVFYSPCLKAWLTLLDSSIPLSSPLQCIWPLIQCCECNGIQMPSVCTRAPLRFLPHSFTLVNFPNSLCLFMTHIPSRSYFHRHMRCAWLAKAAACVGIQFSPSLPLPGSLLSPPVSTCSKVTA